MSVIDLERIITEIETGSSYDFTRLSDKYELQHIGEIILSYSLIQWLTNSMNLNKVSNDIRQIFKHQDDLLQYSSQILEFIGKNNLETNYVEIELDNPIEDPYGAWLQKILELETRKKLASNYTHHPYQVVNTLLMGRLLDYDHEIASIADHFCGSGNLIMGYLAQDIVTPSVIMINDVMPTAVLLAFCRVYSFNSDIKIISSIQDGFSVEYQSDLVLINPPYTRSHRISAETSKLLLPLSKKLEKIDKQSGKKSRVGHAGLHFWALLQLEDLLTVSGIALVVLPRAIINAVYTQSLKHHLLTIYDKLEITEYSGQKAFSQGSELKELVLGLKISNPSLEKDRNSNSQVVFSYLSYPDYSLSTNQLVDRIELHQNWNWEKYLLPKPLVDVGEKLVNDIGLYTDKDLMITIKRGIEMYGPNIFFFPNKNWRIDDSQSADYMIVKHKEDDIELKISKSKFRSILRKPNLYKTRVTPKINHFVITLDEELHEKEKKFVEFMKPHAKSARNKFGDIWYYHPTYQLQTKDPTGQIFVIDKLDLSSTPTLAYYTEEEEVCTKNFYVITIPDEVKNKKKVIKFLAAWLNSTLYFILYLINRREIGETYGRLQIIDYSNHKLFPDLSKLAENSETPEFDKVIAEFDKLRVNKISDLVSQIFNLEKIDLDKALLQYFNLELDPDEIYYTIQQLFENRFGIQPMS